MPLEHTLSIIKPDAVLRGCIGAISHSIEEAGLRIVGIKMLHWSRDVAERFYDVHRSRPFFDELVSFMVSGPLVLQVLEAQQAVSVYRELMGATDPAQAQPHTLRARFASSIGENAVHGSDSVENARLEIAMCFERHEWFPTQRG